MKVVGLIVEYNPFHNGHAYHIEQAKKKTGADVVIAAMSGNFLQRGEPALVSKWTRTEMALRGGVDIVFELPYQFAVQKADIFAYGAVSLLAEAGCDYICFGSESGNIDEFYHTYQFLKEKEELYNSHIQQFISMGYSYPKASSLAFQNLQPANNMVNLSLPNNILGYQYVKTAQEKQYPIQMLTIGRRIADYHDKDFSSASTIASATSIRKTLFSNESNLSDIQSVVPIHTFKLLLQYRESFGSFHDWDIYWPYLQFNLLQSNPDKLREIYDMEEGIENRLISKAINCEKYSQFMHEIKSKRYTWTRLQRLLTHVLTNSTKSEMHTNKQISYLRLLGMTENGRTYLNKLKKNTSVPIISKRASFSNNQIEMDTRAARIYSIGLPKKYRKLALELEFSHQPIYLRYSKSVK